MPNRILKESITTSSTVDQLTAEEERFFCRLIVVADDYGRMDARSTVLRARCFPLKLNRVSDRAVGRWLRRLGEVELVRLYCVDGAPYLEFVTWPEHQQVRAKRSRYPGPPPGDGSDTAGNHLLADASTCPRNPIQSVSESNSVSESEPDASASSEQTSPNGVAATVPAERDEHGDGVEQGSEIDQVEPMPDLEQFAVETARAFGESRQRGDYHRQLTVLYRHSDHHDPGEFLMVAHRARDQTQRQKPRRKRAYFVATLTNLLRE